MPRAPIGHTFTITNIGPLGGTALIPTINYPEVAILGMGRVQEKPVVRDGQIVVRKMRVTLIHVEKDKARLLTEARRVETAHRTRGGNVPAHVIDDLRVAIVAIDGEDGE